MQPWNEPNDYGRFSGLIIGGPEDGRWKDASDPYFRGVSAELPPWLTPVNSGLEAVTAEIRHTVYRFYIHREHKRSWGFWVPEELHQQGPAAVLDRVFNHYRPGGREQ